MSNLFFNAIVWKKISNFFSMNSAVKNIEMFLAVKKFGKFFAAEFIKKNSIFFRKIRKIYFCYKKKKGQGWGILNNVFQENPT